MSSLTTVLWKQVKDDIDARLGRRFGHLRKLLGAGVGALQLNIVLSPGDVLALDLPHNLVDQLDRIGIREQLIAGEHVGEDVHSEKAELGTEYIFTQLSRHTGLGGKERESWRFSEHE